MVAGRLRAFQRIARALRRPSLEFLARRNRSPRTPEALLQLRADLKDQLELERFLQFAFFEQWKALRAYSAERGIRIIGDVAIFVSYDSADVWTHPEIFRLRRGPLAGIRGRRAARRIQRDRSALGQSALRLGWLSNRVATIGGSSACGGRWQPATSFASITFAATKPAGKFPPTSRQRSTVIGLPAPTTTCSRPSRGTRPLPFIAEDLGYITPEVRELAQEARYPRHESHAVRFWRSRRSHLPAAHVHRRLRGLYRDPRQQHHGGMVGWGRDREREALGVRISSATPTTESTGHSFALRLLRSRFWL